MTRFVCIHGHFYQPPRENPWLEKVELQDSAFPYHDWNERITAECYAPNAVSRILDGERNIIDITNNYSSISFNFGPTLFSWMEKHSPDTYQQILKADLLSQEKFSGHGAAIAQAYNHMIMPLANIRDRKTQIQWGIEDFEYRFQRKPEGMWLPETAVDLDTLDLLSQYGIKFTILAPRQAKRVRNAGSSEWVDASDEKINSQKAYYCSLPSGRTIALFFYEGGISKEIAFGNLLSNGESFANRLTESFGDDENPLVHVATDGETYGHHHSMGDMALAYCLYYLESKTDVQLTIYGEYLEKFPPVDEVEIYENSSWSCIHGVERWRTDCGCNSGMKGEWNQKWRAPLRGALDWLRDNLINIYNEKMEPLTKNAVLMRDNYVRVILNRNKDYVDVFLKEHQTRDLSEKEIQLVLKALEMQRNAMLMYTSCGWFFDEVSGIETVQVMGYAARALQLAKEISGITLESTFINLLKRAPSNISELKSGASAYTRYVIPSIVDILRVGIHFAVSSLFHDYSETDQVYIFSVQVKKYERMEAGKQRLAMGFLSIQNHYTRDTEMISFVVLHLGDHNFINGGGILKSEDDFKSMCEDVRKNWVKGEIAGVIHQIDKYFGAHQYSLWQLFREEQREILREILSAGFKENMTFFKQIHDNQYPVMLAVKGLNVPVPKYFFAIMETIFEDELRKILIEETEFNKERFQVIVDEAIEWKLTFDEKNMGYFVSERINHFMAEWKEKPEDLSLIQKINDCFEILERLALPLNLWKSENIYFFIGKNFLQFFSDKAENKDANAQNWIRLFTELGEYLKVRIL